MKITCHSCAAKYTVSDEKVQGKTVKMKCRKCGATIVVGGAASAGEGAPDDAGVDLPAGSYLVNVTEGDQRTMQLAEIVEAYNQGVVTGDTYVWADGMSDWQALSENEAIVAALNAAAGGAAPAASAYGGTNGTNGNHAYDAPAPYAAPAATGYGSGGDVYGGTPAFASSASESNRPSAARKEPARKADLFGGGGGGYDAPGLTSAASSPGTGKRDENSVLFSLSALTATSGPPSRPVGATTATKEDSGLIDLKALAASATPAPAAAPATPAIDAVGLFPLGAPVAAPAPAPMAMGPGSVALAQPQKRSPLPLVLGGLVAVAAIVGVFFVVRGSGEQAPTATAAANTPPPPTATATDTAAGATAEPAASATAEPTESAVADASASASAAPVAKAGGGGYKGGGAKGGGAAKGGSTAAAPAGGTSKPPAGGGGAKGACAHCGTDLHCAMKCSAGKK
ncbi:MAG: zinc-ribbon domain-containing protein [Myxococcales bacterium]|nr:zinc-ribbon domain-containing protein [Myxococcales bacterium]